MLAPFAAVRHRPGPFAISLGSPDPDRDPTPRRPGEYGAPNPGQNAPLEQGFGMCSVIVRETGEYAGWVTLAVPAFLPAILPAVEIGWRLRRMHWGRGMPPRRPRNCCASGSPELGWTGSSASATSVTRGQRA
jgi:hypothetical protein